MNIYANRYSPAHGWQWTLERDCLPENADSWLAIFQEDEPDVTFVAATKRPRTQNQNRAA
jgi:hypothetical protein